MRPEIEETSFGSIKIDGEVYRHDILLDRSGAVRRRRKELSKSRYGTSHTLSLAEVEDLFDPGIEQLVVGTGQFGRVKLSDEAAGFLRQQGCQPILAPTAEAADIWNAAQGAVAGLFHITC
jgi:hypothetical protein